MATEMILMADVKDLGAEGDIVTVADGYARNYLMPRKLGAPVTEAARRRLARIRREREAALAADLEAARKRAAALAGASCTLPVKVGQDEKLYGSVTPADIAVALKAQGIEVDKRDILLEEPIRELGVFDIPVRLHPEVSASVKVWVVEE
ncbi:MAG: 50S ribosomal protein L9 [Lentisphaerae bacterium]|nr:50S ribosomal protein L9 [Lentisphaerota bacterium]